MTLKKVIAVIMIVVFATLLLPLAIVYLMGAGGDTVQDKIVKQNSDCEKHKLAQLGSIS